MPAILNIEMISSEPGVQMVGIMPPPYHLFALLFQLSFTGFIFSCSINREAAQEYSICVMGRSNPIKSIKPRVSILINPHE